MIQHLAWNLLVVFLFFRSSPRENRDNEQLVVMVMNEVLTRDEVRCSNMLTMTTGS